MNACVHNLNWTHFRALLRVPDENARMWYINEVAREGWSSRTLDRNISTQYYYRLMQSPKKYAIHYIELILFVSSFVILRKFKTNPIKIIFGTALIGTIMYVIV